MLSCHVSPFPAAVFLMKYPLGRLPLQRIYRQVQHFPQVRGHGQNLVTGCVSWSMYGAGKRTIDVHAGILQQRPVLPVFLPGGVHNRQQLLPR